MIFQELLIGTTEKMADLLFVKITSRMLFLHVLQLIICNNELVRVN